MIDALVAALKEEFDGDVEIHTSAPSQVPSSGIVVMPGDPFLVTSTHGTVEETWDILVTAKLINPDRGIRKQRELSLRVRKAVGRAGALWVSASAPRYVSESEKSFTAMVNVVKFSYNPNDITDSQ